MAGSLDRGHDRPQSDPSALPDADLVTSGAGADGRTFAAVRAAMTPLQVDANVVADKVLSAFAQVFAVASGLDWVPPFVASLVVGAPLPIKSCLWARVSSMVASVSQQGAASRTTARLSAFHLSALGVLAGELTAYDGKGACSAGGVADLVAGLDLSTVPALAAFLVFGTSLLCGVTATAADAASSGGGGPSSSASIPASGGGSGSAERPRIGLGDQGRAVTPVGQRSESGVVPPGLVQRLLWARSVALPILEGTTAEDAALPMRTAVRDLDAVLSTPVGLRLVASAGALGRPRAVADALALCRSGELDAATALAVLTAVTIGVGAGAGADVGGNSANNGGVDGVDRRSPVEASGHTTIGTLMDACPGDGSSSMRRPLSALGAVAEKVVSLLLTQRWMKGQRSSSGSIVGAAPVLSEMAAFLERQAAGRQATADAAIAVVFRIVSQVPAQAVFGTAGSHRGGGGDNNDGGSAWVAVMARFLRAARIGCSWEPHRTELLVACLTCCCCDNANGRTASAGVASLFGCHAGLDAALARAWSPSCTAALNDLADAVGACANGGANVGDSLVNHVRAASGRAERASVLAAGLAAPRPAWTQSGSDDEVGEILALGDDQATGAAAGSLVGRHLGATMAERCDEGLAAAPVLIQRLERVLAGLCDVDGGVLAPGPAAFARGLGIQVATIGGEARRRLAMSFGSGAGGDGDGDGDEDLAGLERLLVVLLAVDAGLLNSLGTSATAAGGGSGPAHVCAFALGAAAETDLVARCRDNLADNTAWIVGLVECYVVLAGAPTVKACLGVAALTRIAALVEAALDAGAGHRRNAGSDEADVLPPGLRRRLCEVDDDLGAL